MARLDGWVGWRGGVMVQCGCRLSPLVALALVLLRPSWALSSSSLGWSLCLLRIADGFAWLFSSRVCSLFFLLLFFRVLGFLEFWVVF